MDLSGTLEIWDALRAAAEADLAFAQAIMDSAGVIVQNADLTICYDERSANYELPKYVLSEPTSLVQDYYRGLLTTKADHEEIRLKLDVKHVDLFKKAGGSLKVKK